MLVDKMKEVQLVAESKALKIDPIRRIFSRFDKTVYIEEPISQDILVKGDKIVYIEASKFFALLQMIKSISIEENCCLLVLTNNAEYSLPFLTLVWEEQSFNKDEATVSVPIKMAAGRLSSATLKNLANPMLQCVYIDEVTAVSCNSEVACIDGNVVSTTPLILPPDVLDLVEGKETTINIVGDNYVMQIGEAFVFVPIPQLDYAETAKTLRSRLPEGAAKYPVGTLVDSLKRLSTFGDYVVFDGEKVLCGVDYEPFTFPTAVKEYQYNIQFLLTVLPQVRTITQIEGVMLAYGDQFLFMISAEPVEG